MGLKHLSIRKRIYLSFSVLGFLFVINGVSTIAIINYTNGIDYRITKVIDPSLESLDEFKKMMIESKMYATNWVFLRSSQEDKDALIKLQTVDYPKLKKEMQGHSTHWEQGNWVDSLNTVLTGFEEVVSEEKEIMAALQNFDDYDDPISKLGSEAQLEERIIPRTASLIDKLDRIVAFGENIKAAENKQVVYYTKALRWLIGFLIVIIITLGVLLSFYLTGRIIDPINKISLIVEDMGKGVTNYVDHNANGDEVGVMVKAVNHLSDKLRETATFAQEVGKQNFEYPFQPLSEQDTLGKSLLVMRERLKTSSMRIKEAQRLAKVGNWNIDFKNHQTTWSDEMLIIYGLLGHDEVDQNSFLDFAWPSDRETIRKKIKEARRTGQPVEFSHRIMHKDGSEKIVNTKLMAIANRDGEIERMFGTTQDVTEQRKSEERLRFTEQLLREAQQLAKVGNWNFDVRTNEVFWSEGIRVIFGVDENFSPNFDSYIGMLHEDDKEWVLKELEEAHRTGKSIENEYRIRRGDGKVRVLHSYTKSVLDADGQPARIFGTSQDITELKEAQNELEKTLQDLEKRVEERTKDLSITNEALRDEIRERVRMGKELEAKTKDILDSINYAERMQKAIFPDIETFHRNFTKSFIFNRQKNVVGGDFYWFHKQRKNVMITCGDCTGHGVPGAFMSILGVELLNNIIVEQQWKYPTLILELLDDGISNIFSEGKNNSMSDGMDVSFCLINRVEKKVQFAGAMNPIVIISDGEETVYKGSRFGLGAYMEKSAKRFETQDIPYKEGDMLYMFTDGYQDQFGGEKNKKFKPKNLVELLKKIHHLPGEEQHKMLEKTFDEWKGDEEQTDDVLVIGVEL